MEWHYAYTSRIWPSVLTVLLLILLAYYGWRRRIVPGAIPFLIGCLFAALWMGGSVMEYLAVDVATKITWVKFQASFQLPYITATTCFFLEFIWPGRWVNRWTLGVMSIPVLIVLGAILTNDTYHLMWLNFELDRPVNRQLGVFAWFFIAYAIVLGIINFIILVWLFIHSPKHRWPVTALMTGMLTGYTVYLLERTYILRPDMPLDMVMIAFTYFMYAIVMLGFRIMDPIPQARLMAVEQLQAGIIVLDPWGRLVSLNPEAERIFEVPANNAKGKLINELLPAYLNVPLADDEATEIEIEVKSGQVIRHYSLAVSLLKGWRGFEVGRLLLLHDITENKQAQVKLLEQQRALAMMREREQLARELHDDIGQVLGYVKMQAQAARDLLAQDHKEVVDGQLVKLIAVAQDAHTNLREYFLSAKADPSDQLGFLFSLQLYLKRFGEIFPLQPKLIQTPDWNDDNLTATVAAQLMRIIQEALSNARKHGFAEHVWVRLETDENCIRAVVQDDGQGFAPLLLKSASPDHYGLQFMRDRAEQIGGNLTIESQPGIGTRVVVEVPRNGSPR